MFDLVFCKSKNRKKIKELGKKLGFDDVFFMSDLILIKKDDAKELQKQLAKAKTTRKSIFVLGSNDIINRIALERKVDVLLSPEYARKKDFMHYRNSGLNHVLCKIAAKNNVAIGINFNDILKTKEKDKALLIGRIMQNVRLCRKYKVKMILASFAAKADEMVNAYDLRSFANAIGMSPQQAKESVENIRKIIKK